MLITHDARCDPTREATASRVYQEKSNLRYLAWTARQTFHVLRYSSLRTVSVLISDSSRDEVVTARFNDDNICYGQEQLDAAIQNSRITTSWYHSTVTW